MFDGFVLITLLVLIILFIKNFIPIAPPPMFVALYNNNYVSPQFQLECKLKVSLNLNVTLTKFRTVGKGRF